MLNRCPRFGEGREFSDFFLFWLWIWAPQNVPLPEFLIVNFDIADFGFEHSKHPPHPNWNFSIQECIPVGCVPPAHWPHPVVSAGGARGYASLGGGVIARGDLGGPGGMHDWGMHAQGGACLGGMHAPVLCMSRGCAWHACPLWTEWQMLVKILPCTKLRLRAVKMRRLCYIPEGACVVYRQTILYDRYCRPSKRVDAQANVNTFALPLRIH